MSKKTDKQGYNDKTTMSNKNNSNGVKDNHVMDVQNKANDKSARETNAKNCR